MVPIILRAGLTIVSISSPNPTAETIKQKRGKNEVQLGQYSWYGWIVQKACDDDLTKAIPVDMELGGCCPLNGGFSGENE
jgi:hypothetical protein